MEFEVKVNVGIPVSAEDAVKVTVVVKLNMVFVWGVNIKLTVDPRTHWFWLLT